jgi:hypothetical protein
MTIVCNNPSASYRPRQLHKTESGVPSLRNQRASSSACTLSPAATRVKASRIWPAVSGAGKQSQIGLPINSAGLKPVIASQWLFACVILPVASVTTIRILVDKRHPYKNHKPMHLRQLRTDSAPHNVAETKLGRLALTQFPCCGQKTSCVLKLNSWAPVVNFFLQRRHQNNFAAAHNAGEMYLKDEAVVAPSATTLVRGVSRC